MKTTEKAYAKINIALNVMGKADGYHVLDTVVSTVNLHDTITVTSRKDDKITLRYAGESPFFVREEVENNACRAARAFMEEFDTCGVDLILQKRIPLSGGMGGSSTDASAVLRAMSRIYEKSEENLYPLANKLGSDTAYLLNGGFARLRGRGEIIQPFKCEKTLHFVAVFCKGGVNTSQCFLRYDELNYSAESADNSLIEPLIASLTGETVEYCQFKNALFKAACDVNPDVEKAYAALKSLSPLACVMSGSGSAVLGFFETPELCRWAEYKLKRNGIFDKVLTLHTI